MKKGYRILFLISLLAVICFGMMFCIEASSRFDSEPKVLFEADFDSGGSITKVGFRYSGNKTAKIVDIGGRRAVKTSLNRFKDEVSYRSEIQPKVFFKRNFIFFKDQEAMAVLGKEYRYSISIFLPEDWKFDSYLKMLMQWHGFPDQRLGEKWRYPPISLEIHESKSGIGNNYIIGIRSDSNKITSTSGHYERGPYEIIEEFDLGPIIGDLGKWTRWVFQIKWSYRSDGELIVWKDGNIVLERINRPNAYNDEFGPFWKFGVYIPHWTKELYDQRPGFDVYTAYFDEVRIEELPQRR